MDKRTQAHNANGNYLFGWWGAYWYVVGSYYTRLNNGLKCFSMDKSHQTNGLKLGFACENYDRYVGNSVKAHYFNVVKDFKAYFIDMDYRKQTNNLIYGK